MGLIAIPVPGKAKSENLCRAFVKGAPKDAKGFCFYGVTYENLGEYRKVLKTGADFYTLDNSYFDSVRGQQFRVTKNAFQVRDARNLKTDGKRLAALGLTLGEWQNNHAGHWLAVEQSKVFMDCTANDPDWLKVRARELPGEVRWRRWNANKPTIQTTLPQDLVGARGLVTYASAAAVTATLAGVPSIVSSGSAIYGMRHDERLHFMQVLADNQWDLSEIQEGVAWAHLSK